MVSWNPNAAGSTKPGQLQFTAAFGVDEQLAEKFAEDRDFLHFVLMERRDRNLHEQALLERDRDAAIALGEKLNRESIQLKIDGHALDEWFARKEHFRKRDNIFIRSICCWMR